ncbi:MAG: hypothetical protein ACI4RI_03575, partial [Ruminococcus sp.]
QTEDLTLDGTLYTVTGWGAEYGAKLPGVWGTVEPTTTTVEETTSSVEETTTTVEETSSSVEETTSSSTTSTTAPVGDQVTLTLVDGTPENWLANAGAVFVLVDNSTGTSYDMTGGEGTWTVTVPASVTDITINRNSPNDGTTWNSWTTTRGTGTTYTATGSGAGSWDNGSDPTSPSTPEGDEVTLTLVDGTTENWLKNSGAVFVLVDNSTGTSYNMTGSAGTWTVTVPASVTNITINRNSPNDGTTWNSWTTTRGTGTTYTATGSGVGSWG